MINSLGGTGGGLGVTGNFATENAVFFGNVGIGTANPGYKLDIQGGQINASGGLSINGSSVIDSTGKWVGSPLEGAHKQVFTSNSTFTVPANVATLYVTMVGGGGGGGGCGCRSAGSGHTGGTTVFGALSAAGGGGGVQSNNPYQVIGGSGGAAPSGGFAGSRGGYGDNARLIQMNGAGSLFGPGGTANTSGVNPGSGGGAGSGGGSGGSGAYYLDYPLSVTPGQRLTVTIGYGGAGALDPLSPPGSGANGLVIVEW